MSTNNNVVLTDADLSDIQARVDRVLGYVKQSASAWLSIAEEFYAAKEKFSTIGFQRFTLDCGFTHSVADKLVKIGSRAILHTEENLPKIASVEGWTSLYEISKLEDKQINSLLETVGNDNKQLTREVIQNFAGSKPLDSKRMVIASIEIDSTQLKFLSLPQFNNLKVRLNDLQNEIDRLNAGFCVKSRNKTIAILEGRATSNSVPVIVKSAA